MSLDSDNENVPEIGKNLCMHIAAMKPESIDINDLDKNIVEKEEKIQKELTLFTILFSFKKSAT